MRETLSTVAGRLCTRIESFFLPSALLSAAEPEKLRRFLTVLLCVWGTVWFITPLLALDNAFIDVSENIIWAAISSAATIRTRI